MLYSLCNVLCECRLLYLFCQETYKSHYQTMCTSQGIIKENLKLRVKYSIHPYRSKRQCHKIFTACFFAQPEKNYLVPILTTDYYGYKRFFDLRRYSLTWNVFYFFTVKNKKKINLETI